MSQPTLWERVKGGSKTGFDKAWKGMDKLGAPVNRLSNRLGSEAFWPTTLDKESDKAARILKTFCKDGFYAEEEFTNSVGPKQKQKVVKKIPTSVIQNAKGLAIFTTMRTGLWVSGAGGSGILIARQEDGSWSPPSGILLHTAGLGFLVGVDIYDCVVVINTAEALEAFTKIRCTLGSEISVAAGPVGAGGILDSEVYKRQAPIFTYLKSRGFYAGVQIDGTVVIERTDENERFYGQRIPVADILAGKIRHPPFEVRRLLETVRAAQGDSDVDLSILPTEAPPGDYEIDNGHIFGVPNKEDPDPYGVLALEKEGMSVKEAGTLKRASWEAFTFQPSPTSPVHSMYDKRTSMERQRSVSARNSWRYSGGAAGEARSPNNFRSSFDRGNRSSTMSDHATQTMGDDAGLGSGIHSRSSSAAIGGHHTYMQDVPEDEALDTSTPASAPPKSSDPVNVNGYTTPPHTPPPLPHQSSSSYTQLDAGNSPEEPDEAEVQIHQPMNVQTFSPASILTAPIVCKPRLVTVPKREPPKLPPRNPNRFGAATAITEPTAPEVSPPLSTGVAADEVSLDSKHDSAQDHAAVVEGDAADIHVVQEKVESVKLEDDDKFEDAVAEPGAAESEHAAREEAAAAAAAV